jgi:diadenylate cyclase
MIDSLLQIISNEFLKANIGHIFTNFLDIFVIFIIIYVFLYLLKGTEAIPVLVGLFFIYFSYVLFSFLELTTATWVFSTFSQYLALIVVIIFKDDIRKTLAKIGKNNLISRHNNNQGKLESVDELAKAVQTLSKKKIGALILIQLEAELKDRVTGQVPLDANIKRELIEAIFHHNSPIHDGAVIIIDNRIAYASAFLPLTLSRNIPAHFGTRHRAGIGISEITDTIVIVVSEERGTISLVYRGVVKAYSNADELRDAVYTILSSNDI